MKTPFIFITSLILSLTAFSQHQFGAKINGGTSRITRTEKNNSDYKSYLKFSGGGGMYYNFNFGKNSYVGSDVLLLIIQGHEHLEVSQTSTSTSGKVVIYSQSDYYRKLAYLGLPIYYGRNFKKISIDVGIQASVILMNLVNAEGKNQYSNGQNPTSWKSYRSSDLGKGVDLGARLKVGYNISKRIAIECNYYIGTNNVAGNYPSKKERIEQLTFGLKYNFLKDRKKTSE
jgi:hypothetical protein